MEATVVAQLVVAYQERHKRGSDESSVFVVTPHHSQRRAIIAAIKAEQALVGVDDEESFSYVVDTVERMQGQERDLVIVAYGILDASVIKVRAASGSQLVRK